MIKIFKSSKTCKKISFPNVAIPCQSTTVPQHNEAVCVTVCPTRSEGQQGQALVHHVKLAFA